MAVSKLLLAAAVAIPLLVFVVLLFRFLTRKISSEALFGLAGNAILYLAPVAGLMAVIGLFALRQWSLLTLSVYLAIPMVLGPLFLLIFRKRELREVRIDERTFKLLVLLYLIGFTISVLLLTAFEVRNIAYYGMIAIITTLIMLEIMFSDKAKANATVIMAQISMLVLNIFWGINLKYYYYIGRTDILAHEQYVESLLNTGYVTDAFAVYQGNPLWHILTAALYQITGATFPVQDIMFIAINIIFIFVPLGIYLIVTRLTDDRRIGMLSALFTTFYTYFILIGTEALSRSVVSFIGIIILLLLLESKSRVRFALAIFLTFSIVVYHTVGIMYVLAILFIMYLAQKLFVKNPEKEFLSLKYFIISGAITVIYWALGAQTLLNTLLYDASNMGTPSGVMSSVLQTPLSELFNYLQFIPLLLFILVGVVFILRSRHIDDRLKMIAVTALALIPLTFPGPGMFISKVMVNLEMERFFENGFLFMGVTAAVGFIVLFNKVGRSGKALLALAFVAMVLLSVSNDFVACDNPLVKRPFFSHYITQEEIEAVHQLAGISVGYVMADYIPYKYAYNAPFHDQFHMQEVSTPNDSLIQGDPSRVMVFRPAELDKRQLYLIAINGTDFVDNMDWNTMQFYQKDDPMWQQYANYSRVFDSNTVQAYN